MGDGVTDHGCQMLIARFIPLGPSGAQAMTGHHLLEQLLGSKESVTGHCHSLDQCPQSQEVFTGQTWSSDLLGVPRFCPLLTEGIQHGMTHDPILVVKKGFFCIQPLLTNSEIPESSSSLFLPRGHLPAVLITLCSFY